jgi:ATP-dependent DNA helicase PIF1
VSLQILDGADGRNIGGSTLHSWSGIGLGKLPVAKLTEMIRKNNIAVERWRTTGALIIDESEFLSLPVES